MKTLLLGLCIYFCPPLFSKLGERWFPSEFSGDSGAERTRATGNMRRRFWRGFALVVATIGAVLFVQWVRSALIFGVADWLRFAQPPRPSTVVSAAARGWRRRRLEYVGIGASHPAPELIGRAGAVERGGQIIDNGRRGVLRQRVPLHMFAARS